MADGEQTLKMTLRLSERTVQQLQEGADKLGLSLEAYASEVIEQQLSGHDDWSEADRALAEYDRTGVSYSLEEGMAAFDAAVEAELNKQQ